MAQINNPSNHSLNLESSQFLVKLGFNIKTYRTKILKASLDDLAKTLGSSRSTVYRMEKGDGTVSIKHWAKALIVMKTSAAVLESSLPESILLASMLLDAEKETPLKWS